MLKYAAAEGIEEKRQITVQKTRQALYEECGVTVKTLNRTIKRLEEDGLVTVRHGKMTMSLEQYRLARKHVHHYVEYDGRKPERLENLRSADNMVKK